MAAKKYAASKGIVVEVLGLTFQKDRDIPLPAEIEHLPVLGNIISSEQSPNLHQSFPGPPSFFFIFLSFFFPRPMDASL